MFTHQSLLTQRPFWPARIKRRGLQRVAQHAFEADAVKGASLRFNAKPISLSIHSAADVLLQPLQAACVCQQLDQELKVAYTCLHNAPA